MNIEHLIGNLEKRRLKNKLTYSVGKPASEKQINYSEEKLGVLFPYQIRMFYGHYNGLYVYEPAIEIFEIEKLKRMNNLINFCNIDEYISICFDCNELNQAEQWNIVNCDNGFVITLTFSSFWSNKIWAWIDKKRKIWMDQGAALNKLT